MAVGAGINIVVTHILIFIHNRILDLGAHILFVCVVRVEQMFGHYHFRFDQQLRHPLRFQRWFGG